VTAGGRRPAESGSRRRQTRQETQDVVVLAVIGEAAGSHNTYVYDQRRGALRLSGVVAEEASGPLERGAIVNTLGEDGHPLPVLLPVSVATFPGCLIEARIVAAAELTGGEGLSHVCIGVPTADPRWDDVAAVAQLPAAVREALAGATCRPPRWLAAEKAAPLIRTATKAYWEAKARADSVRYGAVWKVTSPPVAAGERAEAEPHTWAEYLVPSLPFRFQKYVEEMLLPEERILLFVERPQFAPSGGLRRRKLRHGLLVITDRQVMTMLDSLPPDATMVAWGYIAKSTAVERLESAWLERSGRGAEFTITIGSGAGAERYSMLFPPEHEETLQEAVGLLERFLEAGASTVRRVYREKPAPSRNGALSLGDLTAKYGHLAEVIAQAGDAEVLAAAAARGPEGRGRGPALVVTQHEVIVFAGSRARTGRVECQSYAIADISSVEIVQSLPGCRFEIFLPSEEELNKVSLEYDYPDSPAFVEAFTTVRHLLGAPVPSASRHGSQGGAGR
jgi:inorganic pyrophosphatase